MKLGQKNVSEHRAVFAEPYFWSEVLIYGISLHAVVAFQSLGMSVFAVGAVLLVCAANAFVTGSLSSNTYRATVFGFYLTGEFIFLLFLRSLHILPAEFGVGRVLYFCLLSALLILLLKLFWRLLGNNSRVEASRLLVILFFAIATMLPFFSSGLIGKVDADWYGNMMADFLEQFRGGVFPIYVGQGEHAYNGAVHPFRSAPWHLYFGGLLDVATLRELNPLAVQHLTAIISGITAPLITYLLLVRLRPAHRWLATLFTILLISSPGMVMPLHQHEMCMTFMTTPVLSVLLYASAKIVEEGRTRHFVLAAISIAFLWLCHPPQALIGSMIAAGLITGRIVFGEVDTAWLKRLLLMVGIVISLTIGYFFSMSEISVTKGDMIVHVALPSLGLTAFCFALVRLSRDFNLRAITLFVLAFGLLYVVQASLFPFLTIFAVLYLLLRPILGRQNFERLEIQLF
ncbi:MAG TPA: hypothetical protein VKC60_10835, partial [Opitutaceae bacterium]|nr:hypothetical protein [Opitutaceae bacterium]